MVNIYPNLRRLIQRGTILQRVLLGNSVVIILGAIAGTIVTRQFTLVGNLDLILLFSAMGILLTLAVNYWIIRTALRPIWELRQAVEQISEDEIKLSPGLRESNDPDILGLLTAMNSMLERLNARSLQLHALSERAINAQEEERKRMARNLHDETAQSLSTLIIQLERLEDLAAKNAPALQSRLAEARRLASMMLEDLRKLIWDLRPSLLDDLGLVPAIRWFARTKLAEKNIEVDFDVPGETFRLDPYMETMLYRISQEAVNNILRHSQARSVSIRLTTDDRCVCLEVQDDGQGFDVGETSEQAVSQKKLGLLGITERISLVGGSMHIDSRPGSGTDLHVCIPLILRELPQEQQRELADEQAVLT